MLEQKVKVDFQFEDTLLNFIVICEVI